jgi:hypothetical protein
MLARQVLENILFGVLGRVKQTRSGTEGKKK